MQWEHRWDNATLMIHATNGKIRTLNAIEIDQIIGALWESDNGDHDIQANLIYMFRKLLDEAIQ